MEPFSSAAGIVTINHLRPGDKVGKYVAKLNLWLLSHVRVKILHLAGRVVPEVTNSIGVFAPKERDQLETESTVETEEQRQVRREQETKR